MSSQTTGVHGEDTAYRDPKVSERVLPVARQSLRLNLLAGERVLGLFAISRFRRSVTLLVVTDLRLLTLGDQHVGMPVVDEVVRSGVTRVRIEREKVFSAGLVTAETREGEVDLGTLNYGPETFNKLEEVLANTHPAPMLVIPTFVPGASARRETPQDGPGPWDHGAQGDQQSRHPLVVHLTALADLHERGALSEDEFAAAKARLLADPLG